MDDESRIPFWHWVGGLLLCYCCCRLWVGCVLAWLTVAVNVELRAQPELLLCAFMWICAINIYDLISKQLNSSRQTPIWESLLSFANFRWHHHIVGMEERLSALWPPLGFGFGRTKHLPFYGHQKEIDRVKEKRSFEIFQCTCFAWAAYFRSVSAADYKRRAHTNLEWSEFSPYVWHWAGSLPLNRGACFLHKLLTVWLTLFCCCLLNSPTCPARGRKISIARRLDGQESQLIVRNHLKAVNCGD